MASFSNWFTYSLSVYYNNLKLVYMIWYYTKWFSFSSLHYWFHTLYQEDIGACFSYAIQHAAFWILLTTYLYSVIEKFEQISASLWNYFDLINCIWVLLLLSHFSCVWFFATPWTAAYQAPPSMGFSRQTLPSPAFES